MEGFQVKPEWATEQVVNPDIGMIERALEHNQILMAKAIKCDENGNLTVSIGNGIYGTIPFELVAFPHIGRIKYAHASSRVGRTVSFRVKSINPATGKIELDRRSVQKDALDYIKSTWTPGDVIKGRVIGSASYGIFIDVGYGLSALLPSEYVSTSGDRNPGKNFKYGQEVRVAIHHIENNKILLTLRELLGTWNENIANFHVGETVEGYVRAVKDYGIFVELAPNLCGLAEPFDGLREGDKVSVIIHDILYRVCRLKLYIVGLSEIQGTPPAYIYYDLRDRLDRWVYSDKAEDKGLITDFDELATQYKSKA